MCDPDDAICDHCILQNTMVTNGVIRCAFVEAPVGAPAGAPMYVSHHLEPFQVAQHMFLGPVVKISLWYCKY